MSKNKNFKFFMIALLTIAFISVSIFLFWKCRYGWSNVDETFYLTIPYRIVYGDSFFVDEWHLSQMSSFLTAPIMYLYLLIRNGQTTGIILHFRYIFTAVWILFVLYILLRLYKINRFGSIVACFAILLYSPSGIMALSYNSMGIITLISSLVTYVSNINRNKFTYFLSGILFAASVLCCPYLVILFTVYVLKSAFNLKKERSATINEFLWVFLGIASLAIIFISFVLCRANIADIFSSFKNIFSDPEHPSLGFISKCNIFFSALLHFSNVAIPCYVIFVALIILSQIKKEWSKVLFAIACITNIVFQYPIVFKMNNINSNMFGLGLLGLFSAFVSKDDNVKLFLKYLYIPGIIYMFCINLGSNTVLVSMGMASSVVLVASVLMISITAQELYQSSFNKLKVLLPILTLSVFAIQICSELVLRYSTVLWEETSMVGQKYSSSEGPQAGILMTEEKLDSYNYFLEDTKELVNAEKSKSVTYISYHFWLYLCREDGINSYSAWLSILTDPVRRQNTIQRLDSYYELHNNNIPDIVYVEKAYEEVATWFCSKYDYIKSKTPYGNIVLNKVNS